MRRFLVGVLAAVALAAAPSAGASPGDDEAFLMTLEVGGFTWTGDGQQLLALGREVCTALDANRSAADVITDISEQNAWPPAKGGYFMGAALGRYCPHHRDRVMREGGRLPG